MPASQTVVIGNKTVLKPESLNTQMRGFVISIFNVFFLVVVCFFASDKVCLLHKMYTMQSHKIADEMWLRRQCSDPIFFANMKSHTSLCEEVENTARIGAMWFALEHVSNSLPFARAWGEIKAVSWPVLGVTAVILILFPSVIVSMVRNVSTPDYAVAYNKSNSISNI